MPSSLLLAILHFPSMLETQCQISNNTQFCFVTKSYNIGIIQKIMYILLLVQHMDKNLKISFYFVLKKHKVG